jgi:hypothetical protein
MILEKIKTTSNITPTDYAIVQDIPPKSEKEETIKNNPLDLQTINKTRVTLFLNIFFFSNIHSLIK